MHQPQSSRTALAMKLGALLLLLTIPSSLAALGLIVYGVSVDSRLIVLNSLWLVGLSLVLLLLFRIIAASAKCPLCRSPVLLDTGAQRHRRSKSLFRSKRLRTANTIVFLNRFSCPYCNEATCCTPKARRVLPPDPYEDPVARREYERKRVRRSSYRDS